jgi:hypothetical protein
VAFTSGFISPATVFAADSPAIWPNGWQKVDFEGTEAFSYIGEDHSSFFSVYPFEKNTPSITKLFDQLRQLRQLKQQGDAALDPVFLPASCYKLKRDDLKTSQTWCERTGGGSVAVVEQGALKMRDEDRARIVLALLKPRATGMQ